MAALPVEETLHPGVAGRIVEIRFSPSGMRQIEVLVAVHGSAHDGLKCGEPFPGYDFRALVGRVDLVRDRPGPPIIVTLDIHKDQMAVVETLDHFDYGLVQVRNI